MRLEPSAALTTELRQRSQEPRTDCRTAAPIRGLLSSRAGSRSQPIIEQRHLARGAGLALLGLLCGGYWSFPTNEVVLAVVIACGVGVILAIVIALLHRHLE